MAVRFEPKFRLGNYAIYPFRQNVINWEIDNLSRNYLALAIVNPLWFGYPRGAVNDGSMVDGSMKQKTIAGSAVTVRQYFRKCWRIAELDVKKQLQRNLNSCWWRG